MKTLHLLRHAKSSWKDPGLDDHDRPLSKRGRQAAKIMAKYLRRSKIGKRGLTAALRSFIKCCDLDSYVGGAWHGQQVRRDSE